MEKEQARWIYKTMNEIRYFEEKAVSYTHLTLPTKA